MKQIAGKVKSLVQDNDFEVYALSAQMTELKVVQGAVGRLLHQLDEITFNKWHEDRGMAAHSIVEMQDMIRLIDMALHPLVKDMQEKVNKVEGYSKDLFDIIVKGSPTIKQKKPLRQQ
ncbi:hypothetical protein [Metasolibacillus meyeri]|uniref:hypothetical protein n=1 Tax=Metasolibacillus meyeri TaxID=1071052 RepID=UPI000D326A5A|nr:hypothetical protein [Metasolibacillus meyeri]